MTAFQQHLLQLLTEIDAICQKNDITYFLAGGTLLGAIRHQGFIPWDDDADIVMDEENWQKFRLACQTQLPVSRFLSSPEDDPTYPNVFPRYGEKDTACIHTNQILTNDPPGVIVDIFILDPFDGSRKDYLRYVKNVMLYADCVNPYSLYGHRFPLGSNHYPLYRQMMNRFGRRPVLSHIEKKLRSFGANNSSKTILRWSSMPLVSPRDFYGKAMRVPFENTTLMIPEKSLSYLLWHYGADFMMIPPHNERESHNAAVNLSVSGDDLRKESQASMDLPSLHQSYYERKKSFLANASMRQQTRDVLSRTRILLCYGNLRSAMQLPDNQTARKNRDILKLEPIYRECLQLQLSPEMAGREDYDHPWRYLFPIVAPYDVYMQQDMLEILLRQGRIRQAVRLCHLFENGSLPTSKEVNQLSHWLEDFYSCIHYIMDHQFYSARDLARDLYNRQPSCPAAIELYLYTLRFTGACSNSFFLQLINKWEQLDPTNKDIDVFRGDHLLSLGQEKEASLLYANAKNDLKNGYEQLRLANHPLPPLNYSIFSSGKGPDHD